MVWKIEVEVDLDIRAGGFKSPTEWPNDGLDDLLGNAPRRVVMTNVETGEKRAFVDGQAA